MHDKAAARGIGFLAGALFCAASLMVANTVLRIVQAEPKDHQSVPLVILILVLIFGGIGVALRIWTRMVTPAERWLAQHEQIASPFGIVASAAGIVGTIGIVVGAAVLVALIVAAFVVFEIMVGICVALFVVGMAL